MITLRNGNCIEGRDVAQTLTRPPSDTTRRSAETPYKRRWRRSALQPVCQTAGAANGSAFSFVRAVQLHVRKLLLRDAAAVLRFNSSCGDDSSPAAKRMRSSIKSAVRVRNVLYSASTVVCRIRRRSKAAAARRSETVDPETSFPNEKKERCSHCTRTRCRNVPLTPCPYNPHLH